MTATVQLGIAANTFAGVSLQNRHRGAVRRTDDLLADHRVMDLRTFVCGA